MALDVAGNKIDLPIDIPKKFYTVKKVLGPTTDFPTWGSSKGNENPQEICL